MSQATKSWQRVQRSRPPGLWGQLADPAAVSGAAGNAELAAERLRRLASSSPPRNAAAGHLCAASSSSQLHSLPLYASFVAPSLMYTTCVCPTRGDGKTSFQSTKSFSTQFSVPGREGYQTNQADQRTSFTKAAAPRRCSPVVTLPPGTPVSSPAVRSGLENVTAKLRAALPGARMASYASTGSRAFVSADGRTTFVLAFRPLTTSPSAITPGRPKAGAGGAGRRDDRRGLPVHLTGVYALQNETGGSGGPGVFLESVLGGARSAGGPRVRVRVTAGVRAPADGDRVDHGHVPAAVGRHIWSPACR